MRYTISTMLAAALVAIALGGCISIHDPATNNPTPTTSTSRQATANPVPVHERGGTIPAAARKAQSTLAASAASGTSQAALERYATLWCNWTAATVISRQRQLASISLGQARAQALAAAASFAADSTLASSQVANSGQVVAIAPGLAGAAGDWVVVTREQTTGQGDYQGLPATLHVTYAQLTHTPDGFVVSLWAPQS
ncbi:MAG: hypothetical protein ACLP50_26140 [Solirubrobacteraceae bacterium]